MRSIDATSTSGPEAVNIALLQWWLAKTDLNTPVPDLFDKVADEWVTGISEERVGEAILQVRDFYAEFMEDVANDPAAQFMLYKYGQRDLLRRWIAVELGLIAKKLPAWEGRLKGIRAAQRKLKIVRQVLES